MLTNTQAYHAMRAFLEVYFKRNLSESDNIRLLLSDSQVSEDGGTVDPEVWYDWVRSADEVIRIADNTCLLTDLQAFNVMRAFLKKYYERVSFSDDIRALLKGLEISENGKSVDPAAWYDWMDAVMYIFSITSRLTNLQAFNAMNTFLKAHYKRTLSDNLGSFLGGLAILEDGGTADPAAWCDWMDAVDELMCAFNNIDLLTDLQAFNAMRAFLQAYYEITCEPEDIGEILKNLEISEDGKTADPQAWYDWMDARAYALKNLTMVTKTQGFKAMILFLEEYVHKISAGVEPLQLVLHDITLEEDGCVREAQTWYDWMDATGNNISLITNIEAFVAMKTFLTKRYCKSSTLPADDLEPFLSSLEILPDGKTADRTILYDWMRLVDQVIAQEKNKK